MTFLRRILLLVGSVILACEISLAQVPTGTPPFGSFAGGPDVINLANLNAHFNVPVLHKAGRGQDFTYDLSYDTSVWYPVTSGSTTSWQPVGNWGWLGQTEVVLGNASHTYTSVSCYYEEVVGKRIIWVHGYDSLYSNFVYQDSFGARHAFSGLQEEDGPCNGPAYTVSGVADDGSGYTLSFDGTTTVYDRSGAVINANSSPSTFADRNGNYISVDSSGNFTDTLGQTALTVAGAGTSSIPLTFTYTAPSNASAVYTMQYGTFTIQTAFGCSNISEYNASNVPLVTEIDLPDHSVNPSDKYTFTYETTPNDTHSPHYITGRLTSVTLPTGGTITYTYTGGSSGNITCSDGSASGLTRQTPDGTWTYTRMLGTGAQSETTVTAPKLSYDSAANQSIVQFQGIYETQRDVYQGSAPSFSSLPIAESSLQTSNLLQEIQTCYAGSTTPLHGHGGSYSH